ncbi:dihydropteroate synthase [Galbibacter sp.]|uniref:dihydropteroate synthase n=1 Tax=Galbibacter sp. TaxID=2918471 RepID=UPI002BB680EA|nr:dihydropteroate synthase [Galbibacter sp.]HLV62253.1 dihydropteroate synthase [Galbibacter sp.]
MTINCKGSLIDLSIPRVMGILNVTPDSFFDGGKYTKETAILKRVETILDQGATFIDLGAYSTRPGAEQVSEQEEIQRSVPITKLILKHFPEALISVDTFRAEVARQNIESGASLINDISGGLLDSQMIPVVGKLQVPYILMHMKGDPKTMQQHTQYDHLIKDLLYYFSQRIQQARIHKINDIIIDPGFGFAKSLDQNYELMAKLELLHILKLPLFVGVSRKSMIYNLLETHPEEALNGTTSLNTIALGKGAHILRVHDVKQAVECVKIHQMINKNNTGV